MISYEIPPHISGDTWYGIGNITFLRNNSALNLSGAYLEMEVKYSIDSPPVLTLNTANSGIVILNPPLSGMISIPERIVDIPPATYQYYLKLVLASGETQTEMGGIWKIDSRFKSRP
jgi:hypothetical protein